MHTIELSTDGEVCRLLLTGKLDIFEAAAVCEAARQAADAGRSIVIHMEGLDRLDTSILQILLALHREVQQRGQSLQVIGASPAVQRICHLLGGDRYLLL
jgi:anti-anti-sigma factor